jgi:hypothetical protein
MRDINDIVADVRRLVLEAVELGAARERHNADELKARIKAALGNADDIATVEVLDESPARRWPDGRLAPGTVKPTILKLITNATKGMTTDEIAKHTGFKPNSVRGTLSALAKEEAITKTGNQWFAARRTNGVLDQLMS